MSRPISDGVYRYNQDIATDWTETHWSCTVLSRFAGIPRGAAWYSALSVRQFWVIRRGTSSPSPPILNERRPHATT